MNCQFYLPKQNRFCHRNSLWGHNRCWQHLFGGSNAVAKGSVAIFSPSSQKWLIGGYCLVVSRSAARGGEDYLVLGLDRATGDTYDLFGGRSDLSHGGEIQKTASVELMEETAGLIRCQPNWFLDSAAIDFEIENYLPSNLPLDEVAYGRCYCIHLSRLNESEFQYNYEILEKKKAPRHWLEKHQIVFFKITDLAKLLQQQFKEKGKIQDGIKAHPVDPQNGRYLGKGDVINRRTTKMIAAHLAAGNFKRVLAGPAIDGRSQVQLEKNPGLLEGTLYYQF